MLSGNGWEELTVERLAVLKTKMLLSRMKAEGQE